MRCSLIFGVLSLACAGCVEGPTIWDPAPRPDTGGSDHTDTLDGCDLSLVPATSSVLPRDDVNFTVVGGSGQVTYAIAENTSGGLISERSGAYLAGPNHGGTDLVRAVDSACPDLVLEATVRVFEGLNVAPRHATLTPSTKVPFEISGGSGEVECDLTGDVSGGSVNGCVYTAGQTPGIDTITISDPVTGEEVIAEFVVDPEARLELPTERWAIGAGTRLTVPVVGGSQSYELSKTGGVGTIDEDGRFFSDTEGRSEIQITDRFTGMSVDIRVDVVSARVPSTVTTDGALQGEAGVYAPGDLDGDGYDDVIVHNSEGSVGARQGGVVQIFAGGSRGLSAEPVQSFYGVALYERIGRRMATGDFDGDGEPDLVVGSQDQLDGLAGAGRVSVYSGVNDGFFDETPSAVWDGERSGDRLGHGLAACDFDGDGFDDLAVSAYGAEDEGIDPLASAQGVVDVHLGGPMGLQPIPDLRLWGRTPDEDGVLRPHANQLLGRTLESGDLNGDGLCDLIVGSYDRGLVTSGSPGAAFVHLGAEDGVSVDPDRIYAVVDGTGNASFGRSMSTGDIDGDGKDELLVGAWRKANGSTNWGSAYLFRGDSYDDGGDLVVAAADADWWVSADTRYDYLGYGAELFDVDGDERADVLIGAPADVQPNTSNRTGVVRIYDAQDVSRKWGDFTSEPPEHILAGDVVGSWYGQDVAGIGDVNGDGVADLAVVAGRDSTDGPGRGAVYITSAGESGPGSRRSFEMLPSGDLIGAVGSMAWLDPRGRNARALYVGAPLSSGGVNPWRGDVVAFADGRGGTVDMADGGSLLSRVYLSTYDRDGTAVADAGDVDGDGYRDLAVASITETRSSTLTTDFVDRRPCGTGSGSAGAVWIYRGQADGETAPTPFRVQWGRQANGYVERIVGGVDHNGDGFDDVLLASKRYNTNRGGFAWMYGKSPLATSLIEPLCDDVGVVHSASSTNFAHAVTALGDIDGDGCDEVAVSAVNDDIESINGGSVRIFWGYGGAGCPREPAISTVHSVDRDGRFGHSVHGGVDVTGDRVPDMIVGAYRLRQEGTILGGAVVLSGAVLALLPRQTIGSVLPSTGDTESAAYTRLSPQVVWGPGDYAYFGQSVALLPGNRVAVAASRADFAGEAWVGTVSIYQLEDGLIDPEPWGIFVGDVDSPRAEVGNGLAPAQTDAGAALAIGAIYYDGDGIDNGGVFPWYLD